MSESHDDVVRREFTLQEPNFSRAGAYYAALGASTVAALQPLTRELIALDVAGGAAHGSEAVAAHVRQVIGVDLTPALLAAGAKRLAERGVCNVLLQEANAARLPSTTLARAFVRYAPVAACGPRKACLGGEQLRQIPRRRAESSY